MRTRLAAVAATGLILLSACSAPPADGVPGAAAPAESTTTATPAGDGAATTAPPSDATSAAPPAGGAGATATPTAEETATPGGDASATPTPGGAETATATPGGDTSATATSRGDTAATSPDAERAPASQPAEPPPVQAPDARPDGQVSDAEVPIAGVAPEANGVNEPDPQQAEGITMVSDKGRGLAAGDVSDSSISGGCVPGYGKDGECLPPVPPRLAAEHAGHAGMDPLAMSMFYTCEDVRALIPHGLATQEDPLQLDSNGDGIACGEGDDSK